ncbi:hypothetical protein [Thermoflavimicrobium daqui]|jgi:hypothetical protein|uniref:Uncharacterized protein n=1 Tax=Thermoflavimicrobium daqui TaxID=2137476 RepID=A0A364K683_9BACL|nr:hypothetical protein [Thermoflavimicrobium daqui]RAL25803.1 hypothetical protein DL897_06930 [Thermoflavimicrobium daqui]
MDRNEKNFFELPPMKQLEFFATDELSYRKNTIKSLLHKFEKLKSPWLPLVTLSLALVSSATASAMPPNSSIYSHVPSPSPLPTLKPAINVTPSLKEKHPFVPTKEMKIVQEPIKQKTHLKSKVIHKVKATTKKPTNSSILITPTKKIERKIDFSDIPTDLPSTNHVIPSEDDVFLSKNNHVKIDKVQPLKLEVFGEINGNAIDLNVEGTISDDHYSSTMHSQNQSEEKVEGNVQTDLRTIEKLKPKKSYEQNREANFHHSKLQGFIEQLAELDIDKVTIEAKGKKYIIQKIANSNSSDPEL